MPFVFIRDYSEELLELNDNLHHVLIESVKKIGGGRKVVRLRQDHRSLPLTLLNDYTEFGHFDAETEKRDCLLYTSPSPRDMRRSRMPSSA